jgi:hypothetical protein
MPATDLERLVVSLEARITQFSKQMDAANRKANGTAGSIEKRFKRMQTNIDSSFSRIGKGLGGIGKGAVGATAAGILGKFSIEAVEQAVGKLAKIGDVAERVEATTNEIQELRYAVEQTGGTADAADSAIQRFAKEFGTAGSSVQKIFQQAGVAIRDSEGNLISTFDAFQKYLDIIQNAGSAQAQLAISAKGFGREGGNAMVLVAKEGAAGFRLLADQARRTGAVISSDVIDPAKALDDRLTSLKTTLANLGDVLLAGIAGPVLEQAMKDLIGFLRETSFWLKILGQVSTRNAAGNFDFQPLINSFKQGTAEYAQRSLAISGPPVTARQAQDSSMAKLAAGQAAPGGGGGGDDLLDLEAKQKTAVEKSTEAIQNKIDALKIEQETLGMTAGEAARYTAIKEALNSAEEQGITLTDKQIIEINALAAEYGKLTTQLETVKTRTEAINETQKAFATEASGAFESLIVDGDKLNEVLSNVLDNLARMLIQASIAGTGPLAGILGTAAPTSGVGAGGAGGLAGIFAGFFARGGTIRAGQIGVTGERGPELVQGGTTGARVIPLDKLQAAGRGRGAQVNIDARIYAPGADTAALARVAAGQEALKRDIPRQIQAGIQNTRSRRMR